MGYLAGAELQNAAGKCNGVRVEAYVLESFQTSFHPHRLRK